MDKNKKNLFKTILLFCIFAVYTMVVKFVDVGKGQEGTDLGLSTVNRAVERHLPFNNFWYTLTEYLGYIALGVCLAFALLGLMQLITRKSLKKVDKEIWVLAGFYVVVMAFYALFEKLVINYRPVILDEGLEPSYPSSHTVLAACVFISAFIVNHKYIRHKLTRTIVNVLMIVFAVFTICGRFISGVHWATDIVGGMLLSAALLMGFWTALNYNFKKN